MYNERYGKGFKILQGAGFKAGDLIGKSVAGIAAPILTGWLIDLSGNYRGAFLLLAGLTGISVVTVLLFHHPDRIWARART